MHILIDNKNYSSFSLFPTNVKFKLKILLNHNLIIYYPLVFFIHPLRYPLVLKNDNSYFLYALILIWSM